MGVQKSTKLRLVLKEMRVWQWTKNVLVFAPLIFGAKLFGTSELTSTILVFLAISFAASTAYVINDLFDIKEDRAHPTKRKRPIASGAISKPEAYVLVGVLLLLASSLSFYVSLAAFALVALYIFLNLFYSKFLKHQPVIDILAVAFFYIYRVYLGAVATDLHVSGWIILTTFFLALFMVVGKRRAESVAASGGKAISRKVLGLYSEKFLDAALILSIGLFITFYSLYSVLVQNGIFILSIFPVIYIALRYLYLVFVQNQGEEPEKLIFKDREILIGGFCLGAIILYSLYTGMAGGVH